MATINSLEMVERIIKGNGIAYEGDPPVLKIVKYITQWGGEAYGLVFEHEDYNRYERSPFVNDPVVMWERTK